MLQESTQMGNYKFDQKLLIFLIKRKVSMLTLVHQLYIGIESLNLPEKTEVITPALTFGTTFDVLLKIILTQFLSMLSL